MLGLKCGLREETDTAQAFKLAVRRTAMAASARCSATSQPRDLTELRLLVELPALRKLADQGLSDQELAVLRKLADATMRSARDGDVPGYLQADMVFHLYLLELTADPALSEVARLVLAPGAVPASCAEEYSHLMVTGAREHRELVNMLTDDMVSAADDLLRHHVSRSWASRRAPAPVLAGPESLRGKGA
jgi:DNA-binding GntR family transcriptional regulator